MALHDTPTEATEAFGDDSQLRSIAEAVLRPDEAIAVLAPCTPMAPSTWRALLRVALGVDARAFGVVVTNQRVLIFAGTTMRRLSAPAAHRSTRFNERPAFDESIADVSVALGRVFSRTTFGIARRGDRRRLWLGVAVDHPDRDAGLEAIVSRLRTAP